MENKNVHQAKAWDKTVQPNQASEVHQYFLDVHVPLPCNAPGLSSEHLNSSPYTEKNKVFDPKFA